MTPKAFQQALRAELGHRGEPQRAVQMQRYLKSELPCAGVRLPEVRALISELATRLDLEDFPTLDAVVRTVFAHAAVREERSGAIALLDVKSARRFQTFEAAELYQWLIVTGAWWDLVDEVATHRLPPLLTLEPKATRALLRSWSRSQDLWLRRSAIIAQVTVRAPDLELLFELIEPALGEKEFFLRKAIGWALRSAAKRQPAAIRAYLRANAARLSGLSTREALKGLR